MKNMDMSVLNKVAFSKGYVLVNGEISKEKSPSVEPSVVQFNRELINLGYTLPEEELYLLNEEFVRTQGKDILENIYKLIGNEGVAWQPLYPGFPEQIWSAVEADLELIQMVHYLFGWVPEKPEEELVDNPQFVKNEEIEKVYRDLTTVRLIDLDGLAEVMKNALEMNQSITPLDKQGIQAILKYKIVEPAKIPFKENLAFYVSSVGHSGLKYCSSISDVLRVIYVNLGLSSILELPQKYLITLGWKRKVENDERNNYKIPNIPRRERKSILSLIENFCISKNVSKDDLKKHRKFWIKLGEKLHPGEYAEQYPLANEIFRICRNDKIDSFGTRLINAYKVDQDQVLKVLSERPGEFFRRFDSVYRREGFSKTKTLNALIDLRSNPSIKVILELLEHLQRRTDEGFVRRVKTVGSRQSFTLPQLKALEEGDVKQIKDYFIMLLMEIYSKQESLAGKTVVIDDRVEDIRLPRDMRNASESLKVVSKGTGFDLPEDAKFIRAYTYWYDTYGNMDLDLYCTFVDESMDKSFNIGWNSCKTSNIAVHSGDVRQVQGHCAEYVDIDINNAIDEGWRYVCLDVHDYNGIGFNKIDNKAGVCTVDKIEGGVTNWNPSKGNIIQAFRLDTTGCSVLSMIVDLVDRKVYLIDENLSGIPVGNYNNPEKKLLIKEYLKEPLLGVKKLLEINSLSRGAKVISECEFNEIVEPVMEDYIFYRKEDFLKDYTLISSLVSE